MSDYFRLHGLQHNRLPCPSPTPGACSSSCPSSRWCHPTISSSVVPFSSCLQSFPASGSFLYIADDPVVLSLHSFLALWAALLLCCFLTQLFPSYLPGWTCDSEANWEERNGDSALWPCVFTCEWGNCFSFLGHTAKPQTTEIYSLSDLEMWSQKSRWWQGPALSKGLEDSLLFALFSYWWSSHPLTCGSISVSVVPLQPPLLPWLHSSQLPWLHSYKITCQGI